MQTLSSNEITSISGGWTFKGAGSTVFTAATTLVTFHRLLELVHVYEGGNIIGSWLDKGCSQEGEFDGDYMRKGFCNLKETYVG